MERRAEVASQYNCEANLKKLTKLKKEAIIKYILNLDLRGFAPTLSAIQNMANKLLTKCGGNQVSKNWLARFVNHKNKFKT